MNRVLTEAQVTPPRAAGPKDIFHSFSRAVCPACGELVDAARLLRGQKVILRKQCPRHGLSEALISGDADWFLHSLSFVRPGSRPHGFSTPIASGCPADCGLCPDHEQHSCLPIIEITNHCNLTCPICLVQNRHNYHMSETEFSALLDGIIAKEGAIDTVNLSGGEPTLHPRFLDFLDLTRRTEIGRVSISTNGIRMAADFDFCRELACRQVYVNLQFEALDEVALGLLRGPGAHRAVKVQALANLEKAGVLTTLVATVAKGVNEPVIGDCVRLLLAKDFLLSLMIQPAAYVGQGGSRFTPHDPLDVLTIPDVIRGCEEQTAGLLRRTDFLPMPCSHPSCFGLTYLLKTEGGFVPFPRFVELESFLDVLANRGTIHPDDRFAQTMQATINQLWSSAGQVPDSGRILRTLKRALRLMYPEDRVLRLEERLAIGEGLVKTIFIHGFMDPHTFELERARKCCTHYALPDGRLMPACVFNVFFRGKGI